MSDPPNEKGEKPTEEADLGTDGTEEKVEPQRDGQTHGISPKGEMREARKKDEHTTKEEDDPGPDHDYDSEAGSHSQHSDESDSRPMSRTSTTQSRGLVVVPRSKRRGLFARFAVLPEVECPHDYKNNTKWFITFTIALAGAAAPFGSSVFYPALSEITKEFDTTQSITNLSVAMYMLAMSIFPLWWATFSEEFGRRSIYIVSFSLFVVFSILSAISTSISMLIVMRLLAGGASASVQAVGAGTIADIWEVRERGRAMGFFYLGPLMGPLLAPFIGGALSQGFGWRSTMWFLVIYGGLMVLVLIFALPETLPRPAPLDRTTTAASTASSVSVHAKRTANFVRRFLLRPFSVIAMLRFPAVFLTVFWASITFGTLYLLNISIQITYEGDPYNFDMLIVGLFYMPPSLGYALASIFGGRWIDRIMARQAEKAGRYDEAGKLVYLPEDRFGENAWVAGTVYPLALLFYGWTADKGLHWAVPAVGTFFFGMSSMLVFSVATTSLTEFMPGRGAEGVAVNNFVRNIFSCVGAIVAEPIISGLGEGYTFTIFGLATLVLGLLSVWMLKAFGKRWRKNMDAALSTPGTP